MMVKNEALIIERCLESVMPVVDGWVVADTGSTDGTGSIIAAMASRWNKPGLLVEHPWSNFGSNRTQVARTTRDWVAEQGWPAEKTYMLFLDADMVLKVSPSFHKQSLGATYYQLAQDTGTLEYWNTRLACLSHDWYCVGSTHEYWEAQGEARGEKLDSVVIEDRGDGGSKDGKLTRDYMLLRQEVARCPGDPRFVFYLAQTCFDGGRFTDAAKWYARRYAMGGWEEERWYSHYKLGLSMLYLGEPQRGAGHLLEAFDERPTRAEPLWALARHHRESGRNHAALLCLDRAVEIPYPADDVLFVEKSIYEWQLWEELMISAWYVPGRSEAGFAASERLLLRRGHDDEFYNYVACNQAFYLPELPRLRSGTFDVDPIRRVHGGDDALVMSCWATDSGRLGLEDLRWTGHGGRVWFTATTQPSGETDDDRAVVLGRMTQTLDRVEHILPLTGLDPGHGEQGCMPWSRDGELLLICAFDPFDVRRVDPSTGATQSIHQCTPCFRASGLCGAAQPLPVPDGHGRWVMLTREVAHRPQGDSWAHRFVEVGAQDGVVAVSRPFHLEGTGTENVTGLSDKGGGILRVTYSLDDGDARWAELDWRSVLDSLHAPLGAASLHATAPDT